MSLLVVLASMSHSASRKVTEVGLALSILGALTLGLGNIRRPHHVSLVLVGACAIALGLLLVVVAVHWGVNPYERQVRSYGDARH